MSLASESKCTFYIATGPLHNIVKGVFEGVGVRDLQEEFEGVSDVVNFLRELRVIRGYEVVYVWGARSWGKEPPREGDIVFFKRSRKKEKELMKDADLRDDEMIRKVRDTIFREYNVLLSDDDIRAAFASRLFVAVGRVVFSVGKSYVTERISERIWGDRSYSNLILMDKRVILFGNAISDAHIKDALGYTHLSLKKFAEAARGFVRPKNPNYEVLNEILEKLGILGGEPTLRELLEIIERIYFSNLERDPYLIYQTVEKILPMVNSELRRRGYREMSLQELEAKIDELHEKYWMSGFHRHPRAPGFPTIIEFRNRIVTRERD